MLYPASKIFLKLLQLCADLDIEVECTNKQEIKVGSRTVYGGFCAILRNNRQYIVVSLSGGMACATVTLAHELGHAIDFIETPMTDEERLHWYELPTIYQREFQAWQNAVDVLAEIDPDKSLWPVLARQRRDSLAGYAELARKNMLRDAELANPLYEM